MAWKRMRRIAKDGNPWNILTKKAMSFSIYDQGDKLRIDEQESVGKNDYKTNGKIEVPKDMVPAFIEVLNEST